ncbi:hypothetical protein [Streptomyces sp. NPDC000618]|uniref:hypothetical protein n=1 Tax=Streptomyces sp. NPDC000618 TaxID=3154265 RepID=UPI00331A09D0
MRSRAFLHGIEPEDHRSHTEALVNVRYALADAAAPGLLSTRGNHDPAAGWAPGEQRHR